MTTTRPCSAWRTRSDADDRFSSFVTTSPHPDSKDSAAGVPARIAALDVVAQVLRKHRPLDAALEEVLTKAGLEARDAGFVHALTHETLRRFGQLEALIATFVPKAPPPHKAGPTLEILLNGACELLFLNVAPHAAVDAANRLAARDSKALHFKALINAVLRRVSREGKAILQAQDSPRLNTPDWLWQRWCESYGEERTRAITGVHEKPAPLDLMLKNSESIRPDDAVALPGNVFRLTGGRVEDLPGYASGDWWVQDFAATLPPRLLDDVRGRTVIDLCAAPGGKTAQLAAAGARVIAVERETSRLAMLRENLARLKLDATLIESDLRDYTPEQPAPCVLLDAPCSATGTVRRHPELPWIKSASDITQCAQASGELLDAAAEMVAPGGTLVFAVCSLEPEEGSEQIEDFLARNDGFCRAPISADEVFGLKDLITENGDLRTLPCHLAEQGGMDGFYAARMRKR
ncbi:MAG: MFS transporter [Proteobacteria bacterium]|nr:MFS transporter [Pseudomonadota bacterium]